MDKINQLQIKINKKSAKNFQRAGFTLLEVLVAAILVGIGFVGAAAFTSDTMKAARKSSTITQASFLAEKQLEKIIAQDFSQLKNGTAVSDDALFNITWDIEKNTPVRYLYTVTVSVSPAKTLGVSPIRMTTVVSQKF